MPVESQQAYIPTMAENRQSGAACINWEKLDRAMAEGQKMAASMAATMVWNEIDLSGKPEEVREPTEQEIEEEFFRQFHEQHDISSDESS